MKLPYVSKIIFFISCFLLVISSGFAQVVNPPVLNCVTHVSVSGNLFVRPIWTNTTNSCGPFIGYNIYRSTNLNGPYTLVYTETNQAATSYDDNITNSSIVYYYYMVSDFNCPGATLLSSDTLDSSDPEPPIINYVTVKIMPPKSTGRLALLRKPMVTSCTGLSVETTFRLIPSMGKQYHLY